MLLQLSDSFRGDFWGVNDLNGIVTEFHSAELDRVWKSKKAKSS